MSKFIGHSYKTSTENAAFCHNALHLFTTIKDPFYYFIQRSPYLEIL